MSFLSLSPELIEEIASYLRAQDLAALTLCCRRFRDVVEGSLLLQYTFRAELAGVYDPLWDLAGRSISDRLETLRRWEASWRDLGKYLISPRLVIPAERDLYGPFFLCDHYLFAVDWQGHPSGMRQPALLYVDLRDALRTERHTWKQIDYPRGSIAITQAFSIEEDDLVVSVLSLPRLDNAPTRTILRFMSLETGGAHPLAREADLQLDTTLPVNLLDVRADVIGDQIVLVLVDLRTDNPDSDVIYLVDWKQGRMTLVHRAPNGTYEGALAVLSPELVLFLKRDTPSIELCRVTSPRSRGRVSHDDDDTLPPSLRIVRTLALPAFHPDYRVHTAYMQTDRHNERQRRVPPPQGDQEQAEARAVRAPPPLPFHSAPEDMVVGITFLLRLRGPPAVWKKVVTTVSHCALFELAADEGCPLDDSDDEDDAEGDDDGDVDVDRVCPAIERGRVLVPWDEWGPLAARVISPSSFQWITAHAGQRWLSLETDKLVIRDFSTVRVRRAHPRYRGRGRARAPKATRIPITTRRDEDEDEEDGAADYSEGSGGGAAAAASDGPQRVRVIQGGSGTCFQGTVVSELPFVETYVDVPGRARDMVLTDGERLVAFVRAGQPPTFDVHVLEDLEPPEAEADAEDSHSSSSGSSATPSSSRSCTPRSRSRTCGEAPALANESDYESAISEASNHESL